MCEADRCTWIFTACCSGLLLHVEEAMPVTMQQQPTAFVYSKMMHGAMQIFEAPLLTGGPAQAPYLGQTRREPIVCAPASEPVPPSKYEQLPPTGHAKERLILSWKQDVKQLAGLVMAVDGAVDGYAAEANQKLTEAALQAVSVCCDA